MNRHLQHTHSRNLLRSDETDRLHARPPGLNVTEKQPTLSYSKLKVEVASLQEENRDLKQKVAKQQTASFSTKTAISELQKGNRELKQRLEDEERQHRDTVSQCEQENLGLETKLF
nr:uncharacterized protein LOC129265384 [Lytechinus pictus]